MKAILRVGSRRALLGAAMLALALLPAAPAAAAPRTIAGPGAGAGKVNGPAGVAVDQETGDLYVGDSANFRIDRFDSEGHFLLAWGAGVADGGSEEPQICGPAAAVPTKRCFMGKSAAGPGAVVPGAVAVEQSSHDVYVVEQSNHRVNKFTPDGHFIYMLGGEVNKTTGADICTAADLAGGDECGAGRNGTGPAEFTFPLSLALDPSGRFWVGDRERLVAFQADGTPFPAAEIALPGTGTISSLAIGSAGDFYVARQPVSERQQVSFEGFGAGGLFRLGNLPAACSATQTGPIAYATGLAGKEKIQAALDAVCGAGGFAVSGINPPPPPHTVLTFNGPLAGVEPCALELRGGKRLGELRDRDARRRSSGEGGTARSGNGEPRENVRRRGLARSARDRLDRQSICR